MPARADNRWSSRLQAAPAAHAETKIRFSLDWIPGTVHAPLFNPLIAAKEFVTADHIGEGRLGVNIVVGWNEDEFEMFGVRQTFGAFHLLVIVALGVTWILDGLEVTLAGSLSGELTQSSSLGLSNAQIGLAGSAYLSGAVLDVFNQEPLPAEHPYWTHPKVHVTPHIAGATNPRTASPGVIENIKRLRSGGELLHRIDPKTGY